MRPGVVTFHSRCGWCSEGEGDLESWEASVLAPLPVWTGLLPKPVAACRSMGACVEGRVALLHGLLLRQCREALACHIGQVQACSASLERVAATRAGVLQQC